MGDACVSVGFSGFGYRREELHHSLMRISGTRISGVHPQLLDWLEVPTEWLFWAELSDLRRSTGFHFHGNRSRCCSPHLVGVQRLLGQRSRVLHVHCSKIECGNRGCQTSKLETRTKANERAMQKHFVLSDLSIAWRLISLSRGCAAICVAWCLITCPVVSAAASSNAQPAPRCHIHFNQLS